MRGREPAHSRTARPDGKCELHGGLDAPVGAAFQPASKRCLPNLQTNVALAQIDIPVTTITGAGAALGHAEVIIAPVDIRMVTGAQTGESVMNSNPLKSRSRAALRALCVAGTIFGVALSSTASFALGTPQQRAACNSDFVRLCLSSVGSDSAIIACMTKNKGRLSARCKATLPPT
jgi:hypothetical protein